MDKRVNRKPDSQYYPVSRTPDSHKNAKEKRHRIVVTIWYRILDTLYLSHLSHSVSFNLQNLAAAYKATLIEKTTY